MKIIKYILYAILALIVLFLLIGFVKPEVDYGAEIVVDKPVKEAWAVTQDESKYAQWLEGFKSIELLSGEKGQVGSTYKVTVNPGEGQEDFEMVETVQSLKEFEHVEMTFDSKAMNFYQKMSFDEQDGKTKIKTDSKVKGKGIFMRSMFALMEMTTGSFTKQEGKNMASLKTLISKNITDYYPEPMISDSLGIEEVLSN